jgi:hypothetical protein
MTLLNGQQVCKAHLHFEEMVINTTLKKIKRIIDSDYAAQKELRMENKFALLSLTWIVKGSFLMTRMMSINVEKIEHIQNQAKKDL